METVFMRKAISVFVSLLILFSPVTEPLSYGLAVLPASQNPEIKARIKASLFRTNIRYAESEDERRLLKTNNANCLLLSSGQYLVARETAQDDHRLLRAVIQTEIEAVMQIIAVEGSEEQKDHYGGIRDRILEHFPVVKNNDLSTDRHVKYIVSRAFGLLVLLKEEIIRRSEISGAEKDFVEKIEPIISAHGEGYFTDEFWDADARRAKIRRARNSGRVFYKVATIDLGEQIRNYHRSNEIERAEIRRTFVPYLLDEDRLTETMNFFDIMLKVAHENASGSMKPVFESIINEDERKKRLINICREYFTNPTIVSKELLESLFESDRSSDDRRKELLDYYRVMQDLEFIQDLLIDDSPYQRIVGYMKQQLQDPTRLKEIFTNDSEGDVFPSAVELHLATSCNLRCKECPNVLDSEGTFIGYEKNGDPLSQEKVETLIEMFYRKGVKTLTFAGGGEPFLYSYLIPVIKSAKKAYPELNLGLYTNGLKLAELSEEDRIVLIENLDRMRISMDASTAKVWADYKNHGKNKEKFYEIWKALRELAELKNKRGSEIKIGASCLVALDCQDHLLRDFINLCMENNLDFCDIKAFADDSSTADREVSSNLMSDVDDILNAKQQDMNVYLEDAFMIEWYFWKYGLDRREIKRPTICWMARMGKKVTIGPYGGIYPCSDSANPGVLEELEGEPLISVLDSFDSPCDLGKQFCDAWDRGWEKRYSINPQEEPYCVPSNDDFNKAMEKLYQDFDDQGILPEDQPVKPESFAYLESRGLSEKKDTVTYNVPSDVEFANILLTDLMHTHLLEGRNYTVRYDTSKLSSSQIEVIKGYINLLRSKNPGGGTIRSIPFSSTQGAEESLIAVYCTDHHNKIIGKGRVDVKVPEGNMQNYLLRVTGMINIAFAASNIPENVTEARLETDYGHIVGFIKRQYKEIQGSELDLPAGSVGLLEKLRYIIIILPKADRRSVEKIREYNELGRDALTSL